MTKVPRAGEVKTRLVPPLTPQMAAELASCFLQDRIAALSCLPGMHYCAVAGMDAFDRQNWLPDEWRCFAQRGGGLGARMNHALGLPCRDGRTPVLLTGTDLPTLPLEYIEDALNVLGAGKADVALTPTADGGFCAVGLRTPCPGLMHSVQFSTTHALAGILRNAENLGLRSYLTPAWYDIDTPADLMRLRQELCASASARRLAQHTWNWICSNAA